MEPTKIHAIDKLAKATRIISELQKNVPVEELQFF